MQQASLRLRRREGQLVLLERQRLDDARRTHDHPSSLHRHRDPQDSRERQEGDRGAVRKVIQITPHVAGTATLARAGKGGTFTLAVTTARGATVSGTIKRS